MMKRRRIWMGSDREMSVKKVIVLCENDMKTIVHFFSLQIICIW